MFRQRIRTCQDLAKITRGQPLFQGKRMRPANAVASPEQPQLRLASALLSNTIILVNAKILRSALALVWLCVVGAGFAIILNYQVASGTAGPTPQRWPAGTPIALDARRDTLILFAHPHCPCTRASLEELNRLLARSQGAVAAHVVFYRPSEFPTNWTRTDLWHSAAALPGVSVREDVDGQLARRLGAETSGYVLLYDPQGQLLFKGGITESRGHAGDNVGEDSIIALLAGKSGALDQTLVYGCSLGNCDSSKGTVLK